MMVGKGCLYRVVAQTTLLCKWGGAANRHPHKRQHHNKSTYPTMDRTFHQRLSPASVCGILAFALLALYMFWTKSALAGCLLAAVVVLMIERVVHTTYVFRRNDGEEEMLYIDNGRFSKTKRIRVNDIVSCRKMSTGFGFSRYVLLQCGHKQLVSVQPDNADAFIEEIRKRQATPE